MKTMALLPSGVVPLPGAGGPWADLMLADNVSTDEIYPVRYSAGVGDFGLAAMAGFRSGDIGYGGLMRMEADCLLAGVNFGCGSAREHAAVSLYDAGIRVVCARSFNATFRRNFINCGGIPTTDFGILHGGAAIEASALCGLSPYEREIVRAGGLMGVKAAGGHITQGHGTAGHTVTEKIIARAAGVPGVRAGDIVPVDPGLLFYYDVHAPLLASRIGAAAIRDGHKCIAFHDHFPHSDKNAAMLAQFDAFTKSHGLVCYRMHGRPSGVCHAIIRDGYALPGDLVLGTDSHTSTCGINNALGLAIGATEAAATMVHGRYTLTVPEAIRIRFTGAPHPDVAAKDIMLRMLAMDFVRDQLTLGRILEYDFAGLSRHFSYDALTVFCNMAIEADAWGAVAIPFAGMMDALRRGHGARADTLGDGAVHPDENAAYARQVDIDVSDIRPGVALPHHPTNYAALGDLPGAIPIAKAFIGSCTGGLLEDIKIAATALGRSPVHKNVRLFVQPASTAIAEAASALGYMDTIVAAGARVLPPWCGGCIGQGEAFVADGETAVWNTNRNFQGRLGGANAQVYIASTRTAVRAAIAGRLGAF